MISLTKSGTAQKIAFNTTYQIIGKLITMTITILITVLITRRYGLVGYGEFNIMQTFPALFFIIVDFGLNAIATRELSVDWSKANQYFANILGIRLLFATILIILSAIALTFFPYSKSLIFGTQLSLLLVLTQALFATTNIIFQVKLRYDLSAIGLSVGSFVILGLAYYASRANLSIVWLNFSYVIGGLVSFLISLRFVKKLGVKISIAFDKQLWKMLFIQSLPLGLMFIFSQINFKADSILLSVLNLPESYGLSNTESVAVYGLPYKIFEVSLVIPTFFMNATYPIYVRHMNKGKNKLKDTFKKTTIFLLGGGIIVGVLGYFFSPFIIQVLGGSQFADSVTVLRILLAGLFIFYITQPISWLIVTLGKQIYLPIVYLISAVINLALNLFFIPKYSFYASAYLTWVSEIVILLLLVFYAKKAWNDKYTKN